MDFLYPFTQEEMERASDEWGCNCGPSALAFAAQIKLDTVRCAIPGFEEKRYTSPMMMRAAIANLKRDFRNLLHRSEPGETQGLSDFLGLLESGSIALVRLQWTGPWTAPGANPKWAYRQTHWIAGWCANIVDARTGLPDRRFKAPDHSLDGNVLPRCPMVFDCNGGMRSLGSWQKEIVPILTSGIKRADGGYYPTHFWRLNA